MLASLLVILGAWFILRRALASTEPHAAPIPSIAPKKPNQQLAQLTSYADRLYSERKLLAAEKAYLNVLKIDHKNVTAYTHLGIIYSTQKNMADAIECFQIATRLHPSGTSYQNLALAYHDNKNYIKSIAAYEKSIMFEPNSARYVGLGRAQLKLHNNAAAITAFEKAAELDPTKRTLERLAEAYGQAGRATDAAATKKRLQQLEP